MPTWGRLTHGRAAGVGRPRCRRDKSVTIGYGGITNVIEYATGVSLANGASWPAGSFEVAAAYLHFNDISNSVCRRFNPVTWQLEDNRARTATDPGNQNYPVIATDDPDHAIGLYAPPALNPLSRQDGEKKYPYFAAFDASLGVIKLNHVVIMSNASERAPQGGANVVSGV